LAADLANESVRLAAEGDTVPFATLINQTNDAIFVVDAVNGRVLYVNDKACANLGYSREELLALLITDYAGNVSDLQRWHAIVAQTRLSGFSLIETQQRRKDGSMLPVEINVRAFQHGGQTFMVSVVRDITERKRAEEALRSEKNKLEAVIAAIGDGITLQDLDYRVLYQNSIHQAKQGNHVGEQCYRAYQHREIICDGCLLEQTFDDGQVHRREATAITGDGVIHMEVSASPVRDGQGHIIAGIEVVRDITSRKLMETELHKAQKLESLGILAGGIAHDFNNLLTAILGSLSLLRLESSLDDKLRALVNEAERASLRARDLTRQLLTFSRGGAPVKKSALLPELIRETARFPLHGSSVKPQFDLPPTLWPAEIDEGQISQVIHNLVINAIQAMPGGGTVTITARNVTLAEAELPALPAGPYLKITISDTGIGIATEHLPKIFDPYFTTKQAGSGLGLATTYSIIKSHGGLVTVDSLLGHGSNFHLYLPAAPVVTSTPAPHHELSSPPLPRRGRILVMDDDDGVRAIAELMLHKMGFEVISARDGVEAIGLYQQSRQANDPFRALIIDLTIPGGMGGRDTIRELLAIDPQVKALVCSGYSHDPVMAHFRQYGFLGVVAKPFRYDDLERELTALLGTDLPQ
jgi:PAS domain S-box-containing protein